MIYLLILLFYLLIGLRVLGWLIVRDGWSAWRTEEWFMMPAIVVGWPIGFRIMCEEIIEDWKG